MATTIRLLGDPAILRDGEEAATPRGHKAWALLAYLLLSERPPTRRQLAELLFADAADPLGTLRWNLAELRRALDGSVIEGDPVKIVLADGVVADVHGEGSAAGGELLGTMEFDGSPAFASWLLVERGRFAGQAAAALHEAALEALAVGNPDEAAQIAARLVAVDPFEETFHELLVRALVARGDRAGALTQVAACRRLFVDELGIEPSDALRRAAETTPATDEKRTGDRGAARAHLQAGEAAIAAGAVEHGLTNLRQGCDAAAACGDRELHARCLASLGSALINAVRGRDEEGAAILTQAVLVAEEAGDRPTIVRALRDLGYADLLLGRRAGCRAAAQAREQPREHRRRARVDPRRPRHEPPRHGRLPRRDRVARGGDGVRAARGRPASGRLVRGVHRARPPRARRDRRGRRRSSTARSRSSSPSSG